MIEVIYDPEGDEEAYVEITNCTINKGVNQVGTLSLTTNNDTFANKLSVPTNIMIKKNNKVIFDGVIQEASYGRDKVRLTAYDRLWFFDRVKRSFLQYEDTTPSKLFTNAFDKNSTFDYFVGDYKDYDTPFLEGYDATKRVIAVDDTEAFVDFFDAQDSTGKQYMDSLASMSHRGSAYKYFYWYDYDDGKTLFFEPEGWGRVVSVEDAILTSDLEVSWKEIYNNITVFGKHARGYYPINRDAWTENIDEWNKSVTGSTTIAQSAYRNSGAYSFLFTLGANIGDAGSISRTIDPAVYLKHVLHTEFYFRTTGNTNHHVLLKLVEGSNYVGVKFNPNSEGMSTGTWYRIIIYGTDVAASSWSLTGTTLSIGNWMTSESSGTVTFEEIDTVIFSDTNNALVTTNTYFDSFAFDQDPIVSENNDLSTGKNEESITNFGERQISVRMNWLKSIASCNVAASNLVKYYSEPQYELSLKVPYFYHFRLNDNFKGDFYGRELTLPIKNITWTFNGSAETTDITLGREKKRLEDLLKTFSKDIINNSYDRGLDYLLF